MLKGKNINYKTGRKQQDDQVPNIQIHSLNKCIISIKKKKEAIKIVSYTKVLP